MELDASIAVVIPAYRAEASVGDVVRRTKRLSTAVLVVDDGSDDGTAEAAQSAGAEVLSHSVNLGKGRALETAFSVLFERGFAAIVTVDADGQHLPEEIPRLVAPWKNGADLVLGTRDHVFVEMSFSRRLSNRATSLGISAVAGTYLPDVQTGFRLYSRGLIGAVGFPEPRFEAESALVVRAARSGFAIVSVPVELGFADGRVTSHYRPIIDSCRIVMAVVRARFDLPTGRNARVGDE